MKSMLMLAMMLATTAAKAEDLTIHIDNFTFSPALVEIHPGTRVTWENRDDIPHTVTDAAAEKTFHSPALDTDDSFAFTFATPGTYHYYCALHPHMQGTVIVK